MNSARQVFVALRRKITNFVTQKPVSTDPYTAKNICLS